MKLFIGYVLGAGSALALTVTSAVVSNWLALFGWLLLSGMLVFGAWGVQPK